MESLNEDRAKMPRGDAGTVEVILKRTFPQSNPVQAREAWIDYHWKRGGGLPIFIQSNNATGNDNSQILERTIYPVLMKESLTLNPCDENASFTELEYRVTETGPFYQDVIENSHFASIIFISSEKPGCEMVWNVTFTVSKWNNFYKYMTQFLVDTSATTVQEALAISRVFRMSTIINDCNLDAKLARDEFLDFVWMKGGGLPLPPPIPFGNTLEGSIVKPNLLRIPPLITESIVDTFSFDQMAGFEYRLNSPGWLTFPFLMHTHKGIIKFSSSNDSSISIDWMVEIRPYKFAAPIVEKLVEMTVSTLLRNLRVHVMEPGAKVVIKPPRGNTDLLMDREDFGSVSKETWFGKVLDAHLSDRRSTIEQSFAMLQPWTWGRTGNGEGADDVRFQWSDA
jgi:hypothetical protein